MAHNSEISAILGKLLTKIDTPLAWKALCALNRGDWLYLTSVKVQIGKYTCPDTLALDLQVAAFLKKNDAIDLGLDLEAKALESFFASEQQCYRSNERLSPLKFDLGHYGSGVKQVFLAWRKEIKRVLGRAPLVTSLSPRMGPGSTFRNVGNLITVADKFDEKYTITSSALVHMHDWDETAWGRFAATNRLPAALTGRLVDAVHPDDVLYSRRQPEIVRGNRFTTVPKDAHKLRGICIEPSINLFYQLGIGAYLSRKMKKVWGWDKQVAQGFHQLLARLGSLTGAVATLDLSNASDTVCHTLVKLLLPNDWFELLTSVRSTHSFVKGHWTRLEKFSSMGNGYTFELETLLFMSGCKALESLEGAREDPYTPGLTISVYGDDIVVPTSMSESVVALLRFSGFSLNLEKSFRSGKFRESCGGDFFAGRSVRPYYLKTDVDSGTDSNLNEPHKLISCANGLRRWAINCEIDSRYWTSAWMRTLDYLPIRIRSLRGPHELGDIVVHDKPAVYERICRTRSSIRYFRCWRPIPNSLLGWDHFRPSVVFACALYGVSEGTFRREEATSYRRSGIVPRVNGSYVSGYRFGRVAYS